MPDQTPNTAAGSLTVMQAHLAADCPDRANCWAKAIHNRYEAQYTVLDTLRAHRYDIADRGDKPDDPGWHVCSCGWEGYWCDWQPHVAERIVTAISEAEDAESELLERKITHA